MAMAMERVDYVVGDRLPPLRVQAELDNGEDLPLDDGLEVLVEMIEFDTLEAKDDFPKTAVLADAAHGIFQYDWADGDLTEGVWLARFSCELAGKPLHAPANGWVLVVVRA